MHGLDSWGKESKRDNLTSFLTATFSLRGSPASASTQTPHRTSRSRRGHSSTQARCLGFVHCVGQRDPGKNTPRHSGKRDRLPNASPASLPDPNPPPPPHPPHAQPQPRPRPQPPLLLRQTFLRWRKTLVRLWRRSARRWEGRRTCWRSFPGLLWVAESTLRPRWIDSALRCLIVYGGDDCVWMESKGVL